VLFRSNKDNDNDNDKEILKILIDNKFDVNGSYRGFSNLFCVIKNNNYILLEEFIRLGAQLDPIYIEEYKKNNYILNNFKNESPLYHAVLNNNNDALQLLINLGIDVNLSDDNMQPLCKAVEMKNIPIIDTLIKSGVDINKPDSNGLTVLYYAVLNEDIDAIHLLFEKGAKINEPDSSILPLIKAIEMKNIPIIDILIKNGADINKSFNYGDTLLTYAIKFYSIDTIKLLIEKGADVNKPNSYGNTPLHFAVLTNKIDVIKLLFEKGAKINKSDYLNRNTSLHMALENTLSIEIADKLIDFGADVNIKNKRDETPLDLAIKNKLPEYIIEKIKSRITTTNTTQTGGYYKKYLKYKQKYLKYKQKYLKF
jgi:ankyrin repeat protein